MENLATLYLGSGMCKLLIENLVYSVELNKPWRTSGTVSVNSFKNPNVRRHKKICGRLKNQVLDF